MKMAKKKPYTTQKLTAIKRPDPLTEIAHQLQRLANAAATMADVQQARFDKEYPDAPEVRAATVGTAEYPKLGEEGAEDEDEEAPWIGPREKRFNEQEEKRQARRAKTGRD
jgi:hypothetical protein